MMRKIIALILSLALLLGCAALAEQADPVENPDKQNLGTISINGAFTLQAKLPEGYRMIYHTAARDEIIAILVKDGDPNAPIMTLHVAFDETYSDVARMNDLTPEEFAVLEETYTSIDPTTEISYEDTSYGTRVLVAKQLGREQDYLSLMSIYKGYFIEYVVTANWEAEDQNLTDEQIAPCIEFLSELDFVPAGEEAETVNLVGRSYTAEFGAYDEENKTLSMTLKEPILFRANEVEALGVGSVLQLEGEPVTVETLEKDDNEVILNGEYYLIKSGSVYTVQMYEKTMLETVGTVDVAISDKVVFIDGVNPETFEALDEAVEHNAAEFIQILTGSGENDVGFTSDNVTVTFDDQGELSVVERFYAPWQ